MLLLPPSTLSSDVADDEELQSDVHRMNFGKSIPGNRTQKVTISDDDTVKLDSIPLATMAEQSVSQSSNGAGGGGRQPTMLWKRPPTVS